MMKRIAIAGLFVLSFLPSARAEIIIAEGESFTPLDKAGWKVAHQQDSYGSHTYGGMWMTHGGCLSAPAASVDSVATCMIDVKEGGTFRVWSKYQAPPYFNYTHRIEWDPLESTCRHASLSIL